MAGLKLDPEQIQELLAQGKGGGGRQARQQDYREGLYAGDSRGPGGTGLDPQTEFDLHENNLAAASHFAGLGFQGMGPNTSLAQQYDANTRAARAEAYNNQIRRTEDTIRLLGAAEKAGYTLGPHGELQREGSGFEAGYKSAIPSTPESGFNPQGAF